jgi:hypothetical protein
MLKRLVLLLLLLGVVSLPSFAVDFHHWRTDGFHVSGSSIGQQASNFAFNITDSQTDPGASSFAEYWEGELQANGGQTARPKYGDPTPTQPLRDNRPQDPEVKWTAAQWPALAAKTPRPPAPVFTPSLPQGWSPVVLDLQSNKSVADDFLISVGFEPLRIDSDPSSAVSLTTTLRNQVLNAYYPQTANGLPGNDSNAFMSTSDGGTVRPLWNRAAPATGLVVRDGGLPGLLIRDLEPVLAQSQTAGTPGLGVVTQPPILARVPAVYRDSTGKTVTEIHSVVYLVVGTGENNDFAKVICLRLDRALPNPIAPPAVNQTLPPPNGKYFNPNAFDPANTNHGDVMWAYTVTARTGAGTPTPVAGISFANIGTATDSRPRLFLTTADGQVICLNAKAADIRSEGQDGDSSLADPANPNAQWIYQTPVASDNITVPGFLYGMSPAVCRVPLSNLFDRTPGSKSQRTVDNAISRFNVSEWMVFFADTYGNFTALDAPGAPIREFGSSRPQGAYGNFTALDAPGAPVLTGTTITSYNPQVRWMDIPPGSTFRQDPRGGRERFLVPALVYQGGTPLTNTAGSPVSGTSDAGFDDAVVFAAERGNVYGLDAVGRLTVNGSTVVGAPDPADDGRPTGTTDFRWKWPNDPLNPGLSDTSFTPASPRIEPRVWPRGLPPIGRISVNLGAPIDTTIAGDLVSYFCRSPLAGSLGANANPNNGNPNLNPGDDLIFVPYMHRTGVGSVGGTSTYYEYVGSLKPYGFIQMSRPVLEVKSATFTQAGATITIPLRRVRVGTVKSGGMASTQSRRILSETGADLGPNPNFDRSVISVEDTLYISSPNWYDDVRDQYINLRFGTQVTVQYDAPTSTSDPTPQTVTETLTYPSCYRLEQIDANVPADPTNSATSRIWRGRASMGDKFQRLEQRRIERFPAPPGSPPGTPPALDPRITNESAAQVDDSEFNPFNSALLPPGRIGAMMAAGSASSAGTLLVPAYFRGRVIALSHNLDFLRAITGFTHPDLETSGVAVGPFGAADGDPGDFADSDPNPMTTTFYVADIPSQPRVGSSVTVVNGWTYITYRNGHIRGYSNQGGGAAGTGGGSRPRFTPPAPTQGGIGTVVWAPEPPDPSALPGNDDGGIHLLDARTIEQARDIVGGKIKIKARYLDSNSTDPDVLSRALMCEYGQTLYFLVDFGGASRLVFPQSVDIANLPPAEQRRDNRIDGQTLQGELRGQIIGGPGAVQGNGVANQGVRPQRIDNTVNGATEDHIAAIVPVFCGIPSGNPLTPGTPLLWQRDPDSNDWNFNGQIIYNVQITHQGVQWRWRPRPTDPLGNTNKIHYWDQERPQGAKRFADTGGMNGVNTKWTWRNEWAPLISYNNPLMIQYDPDDAGPLQGLAGSATGTVTSVDTFAQVLDPARYNGDSYLNNVVAGARSGSGQPQVPVVGAAIAGGQRKQILFGEHGRTTQATSTLYPSLAKLRVADRSFLGTIGQSLRIRVQRAALTKMGTGAALGRAGDPTLANLGAPAGSFEQNSGYLDDGPDGMYSSIPETRLKVTKEGTALDVALTSIPIPGRTPDFQLPVINPTTGRNAMEQLAVQVDVPQYTADDVYVTRWRYNTVSTTVLGAGGSVPSGALPSLAVNPFNFLMWDRAERYARAPYPNPTEDAAMRAAPHQEEQAHPDGTVTPVGAITLGGKQYGARDDRTRRVAVFIDANGNGILDLSPNLREAYRTFAVSVAVKPEMKLEAQQQSIDLGSPWHGKKQPGITRGGVGEILEWQEMSRLAGSGNTTLQNLANFYRQYWRGFNVRNTGNVNLAYLKPEVAYQIAGQPAQIIALPAAGSDPWRALPLFNSTAPAALVDPLQIFLRTSFDDQMLPDASLPYGGGSRGLWLQKARVGSALPGAVTYAARSATGNPILRDPSPERNAGGDVIAAPRGLPRETYLTLNIPTGTPLGQYRGSMRFYNDRGVTLVEDLTTPFGFRYVRPETLIGVGTGVGQNGVLDRDARPIALGEPIEPATEPPMRLAVRVTENTIQGRFNADDTNVVPPPVADADRRMLPAAAPDIAASTAQGQVRRLMVSYASNRANAGQPSLFDLWATQLLIDSTRGLFPFDEVPQFRSPWTTLSGGALPYFTQFSDVATYATFTPPATGRALRSSFAQEPAAPFLGLLAWTEQLTRLTNATNTNTPVREQSEIYYQAVTPTASPRLQIFPGGQPMDTGVVRSGVHMLATVPSTGGPTSWLAFYSRGQGNHRNLAYTTTQNPANPSSWSVEHLIRSSQSLSSVTDPHAIQTDGMVRQPGQLPPGPGEPPGQPDNVALPDLTWVAYSGVNSRMGRTDVYVSRHRLAALLQTRGRGLVDPLGRGQDYGAFTFPRMTADVLQANPTRTIFVSSGADWVVYPKSPVQVYLGRGDISAGAAALAGLGARNGSLALPVPLILPGVLGTASTSGELSFSLNPAVVALGATAADRAELGRARILVDTAAGTVRLTVGARSLAAFLLGNPRALPNSDIPDPILSADYTPSSLRLTRGDATASRPLLIPTLSRGGVPLMDASWYRQWIDTTLNAAGQNKYQLGIPVAGQADRIWVLWKRASGPVTGGPTLYFKVLRPGIRVRAGALFGVRANELIIRVNGIPVVPEEVNPQTGQIFFPHSFEGQPVSVQYNLPSPAGGFVTITESEHAVTWQDESGERPVPMQASVNEDGLDAFASYEDVGMTALNAGLNAIQPTRHLERLWLFWSSTRGSFGDLYFATVAPRIGPDANINGSVTLFTSAGPAAASTSTLRAAIAQANLNERRHPFTVPVVTRRGPYLPTAARTGNLGRASTR